METVQRFFIYDQEVDGKKAYLELARNLSFHFASFGTLEKASRFLKRFGITLTLERTFSNGMIFTCNKVFEDAGYFWKKSELPKNVKPIKALSNGSIVDCFYKETKDKVIFYRPNPNAKNVYHPLPLKEHIEYQKQNGTF